MTQNMSDGTPETRRIVSYLTSAGIPTDQLTTMWHQVRVDNLKTKTGAFALVWCEGDDGNGDVWWTWRGYDADSGGPALNGTETDFREIMRAVMQWWRR